MAENSFLITINDDSICNIYSYENSTFDFTAKLAIDPLLALSSKADITRGAHSLLLEARLNVSFQVLPRASPLLMGGLPLIKEVGLLDCLLLLTAIVFVVRENDPVLSSKNILLEAFVSKSFLFSRRSPPTHTRNISLSALCVAFAVWTAALFGDSCPMIPIATYIVIIKRVTDVHNMK